MGDIVLEIKALTRRFGAVTAVDSLTLSVNAGEVFGLLGSNGAATRFTVFKPESKTHFMTTDGNQINL
jgi:ABC-type branched-subunit amino acid transport system ATPase component